MSASNPQPDDAGTEELVAYLDGELPDAAARRVEQRLATDNDLRRRLGELDQAWSALEVLPTPTVDDRFARTTIEMVALAARKDLTHRTAAETADRRRRLLKFAACGLALLAASFAAARAFLPSQNRMLVAELPVIVRIDELTQVGDIDFLRGLSKLNIQQFVSEDETRPRAPELDVPTTDRDNPENRRLWVEGLSADQKAELSGRLQRFQTLPGGPEEQRRMRQLADDIARAPNRSELEKTMSAYALWLAPQSPGKQAELRDLSSAERIVAVEKLARQSSRNASRKLTPDDEVALRNAVTKFVDGHKSELLEDLRRTNPNLHKQVEEHPGIANMMIMWRAMWDEGSREELQTDLTRELSEPTQAYLASLPQEARAGQLRRWVRDATNPKIGPKELEQFFAEKLSNDQREKLLNLQQAEMESQLERWYVASQMGIPESDWSNFDVPARFGRGGPGAGRPFRDRENGPPGRGEGPREFGGRRFDRGPGGPPPDGPPPGGRPRDSRERRGPPPDDQDHQPPPGPPPR